MNQLLLLSIIVFVLVVVPATAQPGDAAAAEERIETHYDAEKDQTTIRLTPVQIPISDSRYHSLHISPSFSYSGHTPARPKHIDFELQTVVKGRLRTDLYVVFVIEGQTVFLSSSRRAVKNPVRGRVWMGEQLIFRMPLETLLKMARAKDVAIKMDGVNFELREAQLRALQEFAKTIP